DGYFNRDDGTYVLTDASNNILGAWTIQTPDQSQGGTATNQGADSFWLKFNSPVTTDKLLLTANTTEIFEPPPHNTPSYREIQVFRSSNLNGFVFEDFNNDGQVDFNENGIGGVAVELKGTDIQGHSVDLTTSTDANGFYQFTDLVTGAYTVTETQPSGY